MIKITLSEEEKSKLQRARYTKTSYLGERALFVLLSNEGKSVPEIAIQTGHHEHTIRRWLKAYQEGGIKNLKNTPPPGRTNIKGKAMEEHLESVISKSSTEFGYPEEGWTSCLLADYFAKMGIEAITNTIKRTLKKPLGLQTFCKNFT